MQRAAFKVATEGDLRDDEGPLFGHLHIVFRDWRFQGDEESVYNSIFKEERSADPNAAVRNHIRRTVKESFQSVRVWLLPAPSVSTSALNSEMVVEQISTEFRDKIRELRAVLVSGLQSSFI